MSKFTTNWAIKDTMNSKEEQTTIDKPVRISKEIQKKIQLIKKAFR